MNMKIPILVVFFAASCVGYRIEVLRGPHSFILGESPHWDAETQELLFVDIVASKVWRYTPRDGQFYEVTLSQDGLGVSPVIPIAGFSNKYLVGVSRELKMLDWDGTSPLPSNLTTVETLSGFPTSEFNDGKCDRAGRLIVGTYDTNSGGTNGNLYHFDSAGQLVRLLGNISTSNGLAWSANNETMYFIDSESLGVDTFDYEIQTGGISNRRTVFDLVEHGIPGGPDGMTIDSEGNLWVAVWGGSRVIHINPVTGDLIGEIDFGAFASQITSATFGGQDLEILYVTSAALGVDDETFPGSLFAVHDLGVRGAEGGVAFAENMPIIYN